MTSTKLRKAFLDFFVKKDHQVVASSPLIPADPTSLFASAGMQQFVPYLSGEVEPPYKRACSAQKCLRVNDVDEVGDAYHHTFFEMLGNWSFGDYFKEGAIDYALEFLVDNLGLSKNRIWVSVFSGENKIPKDEKAIKIWQNRGIPKERIFEFGMKDNFWGPVTAIGPCGPCSEIHYEIVDKPCKKGKKCGPNCNCGRFVEIWNLVFMEYNKNGAGGYERLPKQNVDTGIGFERLLALLQNKQSGYETDLFWPIIEEIEKSCSKKYDDAKRIFRILADHLRASAFIIGAGVLPSNVDRGYVLRMLLRRIIRHARILNLPDNWYVKPIKKISEIYEDEYPEVRTKQTDILVVIQKEEEKFQKTLEKGIKESERLIKGKKQGEVITGKEVFDLYQSYGFPVELIKEIAKEQEFGIDEQGFKQELEKHKEISRAGKEKKFGGVGIEKITDENERKRATELHTATHLLQASLRKILGEHIAQAGQDITSERLRFDFTHQKPLAKEEIKKVEDWVNQRIKGNLSITRAEMPFKEAINSNALAFFQEKYPEAVSVYTIQDSAGNVFSKEVCAGPHVNATSELGEFKIIKQESIGANTQRIKAVLFFF